jgi:Icc-related predicted phosphoesterase
MGNKTTVFFVTDLHASERCFRKFLHAPKVYGANVLVLGGDVTGKVMVPLIEVDSTYEAFYMGTNHVIPREQIDSTEQMLVNSGMYPFRTTRKEVEEMNASREKVDAKFKELMLQRLQSWIDLANERLRGTGVRLYVTGGNDDLFDVEQYMREHASEIVVPAEGNVVDIDGKHEMLSSGYTNMTPWKCPRDITEEELEAKIEAMVSKISDLKNAIFNLHCPPYGTPIDSAPQLDQDLKPVIGPGGQPKMVSVGSTAVRKCIERHQPLMGLHGHIHESRGVVKLGKSYCFNPGSEYGEGMLRGVFLTLSDKKVESYVFTQG